mgnify:CR=1 FL=1
MEQAVATYATRAGEKLRSANQIAGHLSLFIHTNRFNNDPKYSASGSVRIAEPTNDSRDLIKAALKILKSIWRNGYRYSKAGLILTDLMPSSTRQLDLLIHRPRNEDARLMSVIDHLNQKMGRGTIFPAAAGTRQVWRLRTDYKSPHYTTRWEDLPRAV